MKGNGRCANWDNDWGPCGRCAACVADSGATDTESRLKRIEEKLDELLAESAALKRRVA